MESKQFISFRLSAVASFMAAADRAIIRFWTNSSDLTEGLSRIYQLQRSWRIHLLQSLNYPPTDAASANGFENAQ